MLAICIVVAATILVVGSATISADQNRLLPIYCVETDKKQVAISFDAAWGNTKEVQNIANLHNNRVCDSLIFHKKLNYDALTPYLRKL